MIPLRTRRKPVGGKWYAESDVQVFALIDQIGFGVGLASLKTPHDPVYLDKLEKVLDYRTDIHWIVIIPPCLRLGSC